MSENTAIKILFMQQMATNCNNSDHTAANLGYFTFEIAWEVANKGTNLIFYSFHIIIFTSAVAGLHVYICLICLPKQCSGCMTLFDKLMASMLFCGFYHSLNPCWLKLKFTQRYGMELLYYTCVKSIFD